MTHNVDVKRFIQHNKIHKHVQTLKTTSSLCGSSINERPKQVKFGLTLCRVMNLHE